MCEQRKMEIGVRKVLGASTGSLVRLFTRDFGMLLGVSIIVGLGTAYFAVDRWLANFAYRIDVPVLAFVDACLVVGVVGLATISSVILRASREDPVNVLRD